MNIDQKLWRTIWLCEDRKSVGVIDQSKLPHEFSIKILRSCEDVYVAIKDMVVRGAPLIGVAGAYGLMLAVQKDSREVSIHKAYEKLNSSRPTAINLNFCLNRLKEKVLSVNIDQRVEVAINEAVRITEEDVSMCQLIGKYGFDLFKQIAASSQNKENAYELQVLTHCNAGWLATVDWGTALSPIYKWHREGLGIHVWVDETRPRNQGSSLTAYELAGEGIPHTVIVDNAGGYLMKKGMVDLVIVGADRITASGDVCNKIGTYLKALAAKDNNIPFYVALPCSSIDWDIVDSDLIPIEIRSEDEVASITGRSFSGNHPNRLEKVRLINENSNSFNPGFDITPSRLISGLITDRGIVRADEKSLKNLLVSIKNDLIE